MDNGDLIYNKTYGFSLKVEEDGNFKDISLNDVKAWLRIDKDNVAEDEVLKLLIGATVSMAEQFTGLSLTEKRLVCEWNSYFEPEVIRGGPVNNVIEVYHLNSDGEEQILTSDDYLVIGKGNQKKLVLKTFSGYPTGIRFDGGYDKIPKDIKVALLKQIASDFENRENFVLADEAFNLSAGTMETLKKYRVAVAY